MRYVDAGYVVVLGALFLYAVQLAWRRRRLTRAVARVTGTWPTTDRDPVGTSPSPSSSPSSVEVRR